MTHYLGFDSVFSLRIVGTHLSSGQETLGVLNLVDLAGSERIEKSGAQGQRLEEAKYDFEMVEECGD